MVENGKNTALKMCLKLRYESSEENYSFGIQDETMVLKLLMKLQLPSYNVNCGFLEWNCIT